MNILMKNSVEWPFLQLAFILIALALSPIAQAVVPPPDGGYPNFTTAEGQNALFSLTTGAANTAVGWFSLKSITTGSFNTSVGAGTLVLNTGDANTATGTAALLLNTTGQRNTANGTAALVNNSTGEDNTAVGAFALNSSTASGNTAIGSNALLNNTTGGSNTANGFNALFFNTIGANNTAIGASALNVNVGGLGNTAIGVSALGSNIGGNFNIALGFSAGMSITGGNNIDIGNLGLMAEDNTIRIGNASHQDTFIAGIFGSSIDPFTASPLEIDSTGKLGTMLSSRRFKRHIKPMDSASEAILALKPVTFHYKSDSKNTPCFGLIAEEVALVSPDLVLRDKDGEILSVRYDQVNAMLLNEFLKQHDAFLKEHHKVEKLEATVARQQQGMEALAAQVKEQAGQIQKVSAEIELNKSVARVTEAGQTQEW
jgi:hypothetical protein